MSKKHPKLRDLIREAKQRGLFVLVSGEGDDLKYDFWDNKTGKRVLIYHPRSGRWLMPGAANRSGRADDYLSALANLEI